MAKKNQQQGVVEPKETLNKSEAFFLQHKKPIIIAIIALFVIIAGLFLYKAYVSSPREDKASTAIARGQEYFNSEQFDKALNGDGAGYTGFLKIASDYSSTQAGNLANLYAGLCYANLDKWAEAVKYLEAFSPTDDAMVSPAALAALGNAYAHVNQLDKAVNMLTKAADKADKEGNEGINNSLSPTFRLQAAQILESQGKKDEADAMKQKSTDLKNVVKEEEEKNEALKIYNDIKTKYVTSGLVQSQEIDKYIERATIK